MRLTGIPYDVHAPEPDVSTFRRVQIPEGARGTRETLQEMARLAAEAARDPYFVQEARGIVRGLPPRDQVAEADAILQWVKHGVDYRGDPYEMDWVQSPGWTLYVEGQADCDDGSTLICALDLAIGLGCVLRAARLDSAQPDEFSHVWSLAGVRDGGRALWLAQDFVPTPAVLGQEPPGPWIGEAMDFVVAMP